MGGGVIYPTIFTTQHPSPSLWALGERGAIIGLLVEFGFPPSSFSPFFSSPFRGESIAVGPSALTPSGSSDPPSSEPKKGGFGSVFSILVVWPAAGQKKSEIGIP